MAREVKSKPEARRKELLDYGQFIETFAKELKIPEKRARAIVRAFAAQLALSLRTGKVVKIAGLGAFRLRDDPTTLPVGKRLVFRPAKRLMVSLSGEKS